MKAPVAIEVKDAEVDPGAAPLLPDAIAPVILPQARLLAGGSPLWAWFWRLLVACVGFFVSLWVWDLLTTLFQRNGVLGWIGAVLAGAFLLVLVLLILREALGFVRLARLEGLRQLAARAGVSNDANAAKTVVARLVTLYGRRGEMGEAAHALGKRAESAVDGEALLADAELTLMAGLDRAAEREIERAARQVATVTALVPLALADVLVVLLAGVRMIRGVAEVYGGRPGFFGSLRLMRKILAHLIATGALAVGDDMLGSLAGGGLVAKVSRRFGEGVVNGALTARLGVAAMDVCRPLGFARLARPSVSALLARALRGLFA